MRRLRGLVLMGVAASVTGCASLPTGPSVTALPTAGKPFEVFQAEDAACRQWAAQQIGLPGPPVMQYSAIGVLAGTAIGAVLGTAIGATSGQAGAGAAVGAGAGVLGGAAAGANVDQVAAQYAQRRYDMVYTQCMYAKGNQVLSVVAAPAAPIPPPLPAFRTGPPPVYPGPEVFEPKVP
jgi:hypothetical protein